MPKKQPKKAAPRRPDYMPQHPWCCCACREWHQLKTFTAKARIDDPGRLMPAIRISGAYLAISNGRYGGVELEQLFD